MFSFLLEIWSTEVSSLCSSFVKSFDTLPKQNVMLHLKFANLCFIYMQVTLISIIMYT